MRDEPWFVVAGAGEDGTGGATRRSSPAWSSSRVELVRLKSLTLKTCTVALSLDTASHLESWEKAMQWMSALSVPLLSYNKSQEHQHVNKTKFQWITVLNITR